MLPYNLNSICFYDTVSSTSPREHNQCVSASAVTHSQSPLSFSILYLPALFVLHIYEIEKHQVLNAIFHILQD